MEREVLEEDKTPLVEKSGEVQFRIEVTENELKEMKPNMNAVNDYRNKV